jgi:hypothetical protein
MYSDGIAVSESWYSARMRIVCLIEGVGAHSEHHNVHIFRAADFDSAFVRALEIGRTHEGEYLNGDGETVRWRLARIESLDVIRADNLDGAEVYFEPSLPSEVVAFDAEFHPEAHKPDVTGI